MKKVAFVLGLEVLLIIIITAIILFIFKIIPSNSFSPQNLPLQSSSDSIKSAVVTYIITGTVKSIVRVPNSNKGEWAVQIKEYSNQDLIVGGNIPIQVKSSSENTYTLKSVSEIRPGDQVIATLRYNLKTKTWITPYISSANLKSSLMPTPSPIGQ